MYLIESNATNPNGLVLEVLKTGDVRKLSAGHIMINQLIGTCLEPMANNIYLRLKSDKGEVLKCYPLMGRYATQFLIDDNGVMYMGKIDNFDYAVRFAITDHAWFYDVHISNLASSRTVDLIYTQDIGLATEGHITNNEAFNSQYIDHKTFDTAAGYVICSRQNQSQAGGFPFLQQGSFGKCVSYSVDGFPFFGLDYKFDNKIGDLSRKTLNNRLYQYDFAFSALQSEDIQLADMGISQFTFYGYFKPNLPTGITEPIPMEDIKQLHSQLKEMQTLSGVSQPSDVQCPAQYPIHEKFPVEIDLTNTVSSAPLTLGEVATLYPNRINEEFEGAKLLSFFTETGEHVVLMEKERLVERTHGHIIINFTDFPHDTMTSTNWMYGVFASHIALGNTSLTN